MLEMNPNSWVRKRHLQEETMEDWETGDILWAILTGFSAKPPALTAFAKGFCLSAEVVVGKYGKLSGF